MRERGGKWIVLPIEGEGEVEGEEEGKTMDGGSFVFRLRERWKGVVGKGKGWGRARGRKRE